MQILSLKELQKTAVDMFSTVFIGNCDTKVIDGKHYSRKEKYRTDYLNNIYDCEDEEDYEYLSDEDFREEVFP